MTWFQKWRRGEGAQGLFLISPTLAFTLLLLAVPLVLVVALSFWTQDYLTLHRIFTMDNYKTAWSEPMYQYFAKDFNVGNSLDRTFGLPCGLFHLVLCSAQTQGYVDLFDYHPVLDQLFDAHFSVESDFRL